MAVQPCEDTSGLRPYYPYQKNIFYRVYDDLSAGSCDKHNRFQSAALVLRPDDPASNFTKHALEEHLKWGNRRATPYISIYADGRRALDEAQRRHRVRGGTRVRVAEIHGLADMARSGVFCVSTSELVRVGLLSRFGEVGVYVISDEWFVLGEIPAACVKVVWTVDEFEIKMDPTRKIGSVQVAVRIEGEGGDGKGGSVMMVVEMDDVDVGMKPCGLIRTVTIKKRKAATKPVIGTVQSCD